jgi:hypothetical protein
LLQGQPGSSIENDLTYWTRPKHDGLQRRQQHSDDSEPYDQQSVSSLNEISKRQKVCKRNIFQVISSSCKRPTRRPYPSFTSYTEQPRDQLGLEDGYEFMVRASESQGPAIRFFFYGRPSLNNLVARYQCRLQTAALGGEVKHLTWLQNKFRLKVEPPGAARPTPAESGRILSEASNDVRIYDGAFCTNTPWRVAANGEAFCNNTRA